MLHAQLGRVLLDLEREDVDEPLDGERGLGDAEGAAVGDASRGLVRICAIHLDERLRERVAAGDDVKEPRRVLRRVRGRVERAVVGDRLDPERLHRAVLLRGELGGDVVVARERVGLDVLRAVLDPLDRMSGEDRRADREHVPRIHRHFAAEAAADVGRDHADPLLGEPEVTRDERDHSADRVRRLGSHPDRQLAVYLVEARHDPAGLDRRDVDPRDVEVLLDHDLSVPERLVGPGLVADLPVPDVVVLLLAVLADERRSGLERLDRVHYDRKRLVVDLDRRDAVGRDVTLGRHDSRDLLRLIEHGVGRQDHLAVRHERRHPLELERYEIFARDHGEHAGDGERLRRVDALDARVRVRAARDVQVQHARQLHVVDVVAAASDETRVFLALDALADAADLNRHLGPSLPRSRASFGPRTGSTSRCSRNRCSGRGCRRWPDGSGARSGPDSRPEAPPR